jgi:ADP-ribose pyrophosphatase
MTEPWTVRASRVVFDRWPWLRVHEQHVVLPSGYAIEDFLFVETGAFAAVFALTADEHVLLIEQYRQGVGDVCFELPAGGFVSPDEDPLACAQRELLEETGYAAREWTSLGTFVPDSNRGLGRAHFFLARGAERAGEQRLDDSEEIRVHLVDLATVRAWHRAGRLRTLASVAAVGLALARL